MKENYNIKGWVSSLRNECEFIGWLIDVNDTSSRVAIIKINETYINVNFPKIPTKIPTQNN